MIFEELVNPTKVLPIKMIDGSIVKLHLKGVDFRQEQFVAAVAANKIIQTQEAADLLGAETASRLIRSVVTKVEGLHLRDAKTGETKEFKLVFDSNNMICIPSYTILMRMLNSAADSLDTLEQIKKFYNDTCQLEGVVEKKKSKKKAK